MEINKFDREETLRRFIRKQNWPEFSNDDPNNKNNKTQSQQEMTIDESQPIDNYLKDPNWKLTSNNRLKRNSISNSKDDKHKSTDRNNDGMSLNNDSNKSLQTSKQLSSLSSVLSSRAKTAISSSKSKPIISTLSSSSLAVTYKDPVIEIRNKKAKFNCNKQSRKRMAVPLNSDNEKNKLRRIHVDDDDDDVNKDNFDDDDDGVNEDSFDDNNDYYNDDDNVFDDYNNDDHDVDNDDRNSEPSTHQHQALLRISKQQQHQVFIVHHCSLFLLYIVLFEPILYHTSSSHNNIIFNCM